MKKKEETAVVLHNIRSRHNVGSIFRTANAAGISKIYLSGYTPAPTDRFGREVKEISKTALGAQNMIPWEKVKNPAKVFHSLRLQGYKIIAVEQSGESVDYKKVKARGRTAYVFGNETKGLTGSILGKCDVVAEIPMRGVLQRNRPKADVGKESLNVSVAAGIALFRILNM